MKKASRKSRTSKTQNVDKEVIKLGEGEFNFPNGDAYDGSYMIINKKKIYRHGYGVYKTHDQDEYRAIWDKDDISSNFHITYGNKAEYKGELDDEGTMNGKGTYIFPDGTSISATWKDNQPISDYKYTDPQGYKWYGRLSTDNQEVIFAPENHIWDKKVDSSA